MSNENNDRRAEVEAVAWIGTDKIYRDRLFDNRQMAQNWLEDSDGVERKISPLYSQATIDTFLNTLQTELECLLEDLGTAEQSAVEGLMARINRIEAVIEKAGRS